MAQPDTTWKVLHNDPMQQHADNLWSVEGDLPNMQLRRRMVIVRLRNGDLVIHNAIALDDDGMAKLEALGRPAWLIVPNGWHRIDAPRFKARYPAIQVICPKDSRERVSAVVPVDHTYDTFPQPEADSPTIWFEYFGAKKAMEGAMFARSADGVTVVLGDSLFNLKHMSGLFGLIYGRLMGNAGGPKVTLIGRMFLLAGGGKSAFRAWMERTADIPGLVRVIPGHGDIIAPDAAGALKAVAATL